MKKLIKLLTCAAMLAMVLSLAACGGDDDKSSEKSTTEDKKYTYDSIKDFVDSEEFQAELKTLMDSMDQSEMKMEVSGEGNKLIYSYTYTDIVIDDTTKTAMAEALEEGLTAQSSQFTSLAASLTEEINVTDPIVKVEYIDAEGTVIYEKEFTAK